MKYSISYFIITLDDEIIMGTLGITVDKLTLLDFNYLAKLISQEEGAITIKSLKLEINHES